MKILVLNPSSKIARNVVRDVLYGCWCKGRRIGGGTVPPFSLLMVATVLKQDGNDVVFIDAQAEQKSVSDIKDCIKGSDIVIISTSTMSFNEDAEMLDEFKKINQKLTTVILGSHPTFMPQYALSKPGVDIIVRREPEFIIRDLMRCMRQGSEKWKEVKGIGYRETSDIKINDYYPFIEDLDQLAFLDVTMLPQGIDYFNPIVKRLPYITTSTSRGCPGRCTFCTAPAFDGMRVRFRSAENVIKEIKFYLERDYREIYFRDDTFVVNRKRNREICESIIKEELDVTWLCNARVGMIDKEDMELMKKAGCHYLKFGVESGVQEVLDRSKKGIRVEQTRKTFKWAKEVGIDTHAHIMLGMPGDSNETIKRTIDFALEIEPTTVTFGVCTPYPGTPLFEEVKKRYPEIKDGTAVDLSVLHTKGLFNEIYTDLKRDELEKWIIKAYRKFYLRPGYWIKTLRRIKSIEDLKRFIIAATNVLSFSISGDD